jgi:two-component system, OmpR family, alkaline phosphatase synthesis response regulator PhoP
MNHRAQILIVDDESHLADGIAENLQAEGYDTQVANDGEAGLKKAREGDFDLLILDVMMPRLDGLRLCETLRGEGDNTPVLFLTVKNTPDDRIRGLELGGDDYMAKPFHLRELLLRVTALLRRGAGGNQRKMVLEFAGNTVDFSNYQARSWDGAIHAMTHKEAMILKVLADDDGNILTREDLLDRVWGHEVFPSTRTVDNFIVRLRKRFERDPEEPAHFHTVRGVGYRFTREPSSQGATEPPQRVSRAD